MFSLGVPHPPKVKADGGAQTNEEQGPLSTEFPLESHDSKSMTDPLQVVPKELFLEMLSFVSVKDVAQNCSLVLLSVLHYLNAKCKFIWLILMISRSVGLGVKPQIQLSSGGNICTNFTSHNKLKRQ